PSEHVQVAPFGLVRVVRKRRDGVGGRAKMKPRLRSKRQIAHGCDRGGLTAIQKIEVVEEKLSACRGGPPSPPRARGKEAVVLLVLRSIIDEKEKDVDRTEQLDGRRGALTGVQHGLRQREGKGLPGSPVEPMRSQIPVDATSLSVVCCA